MSILLEARYALEIIDAILTSSAFENEKIAIFADIVRAQETKNKFYWKKILRQYKELSYELYENKENNEWFFSQVYKYIKSKEHS